MTTSKQNKKLRNYQRSKLWELSHIPGFSDSFNNRCSRDDNPELMLQGKLNSELNPLTRDLVESTDFVVHLNDIVDEDLYFEFIDQRFGELTVAKETAIEKSTLCNQITKTIRRRNPEFQQHMDVDNMDSEEVERLQDSEDALDYSDSIGFTAPKAKYDLIETKDFSAIHFPELADKRLKGYSRNLRAAINRGINKRGLQLAIMEARKRGVLTNSQKNRLWELFKINQFTSK